MKRLALLLTVSLLYCTLSKAQSICGTNIVYFNDEMSSDGGITWTNVFDGTPRKFVTITDTNLIQFYRAEHTWLTNTPSFNLLGLIVYSSNTPIIITNRFEVYGKFLSNSETNNLFRPVISIVNLPITTSDPTNSIDETNFPPTNDIYEKINL
jgi:hypothetical protein